ncbi:monocarboxylate transporter 7 [Scaptodrosophila lebanonensis]|uniref:Monocarboxylate transporter 7 n=1 Tax=Drosophila lebanonensis TaxID=7225 RepID=A0A6J2U6C7_DROLE|nr:monocarboxylate transporter 7 [Scaptodrosophila lebanonensis]
MVIQCTCDCNCSDRDANTRNASNTISAFITCHGLQKQQQQQQQHSRTHYSRTASGDDMEDKHSYYRRLSNTSSALYGSCPQLQQLHQLQQQQQQQQHPRPLEHTYQTLTLNRRSRPELLEHCQQRLYSSLVRPKQRSPVLCNKSWWVSCPRLSNLSLQSVQSVAAARHKPLANGGGCYFGYDTHVTDEEDSAFPALADREFHLLHRNIPALRRTGVDTTRIRQYFYPDGGWGWIVCGVSFLVHILTTGLQLSYGLLVYYAVQHLHNTSGIELLGALSWSISMLATPFVVSLCRKRSIRLLSIVGGLVMPLGILFTSFATEFGQVVFSYGIVFGIGVSMVREASTVMLGNYFKRRRQFVEMVAMSGEGVGIALFSVILKEGVGKAGWRLGLQIVAALTALSFFMGLMYRPASLYHPQRRAIQHLKNQRKKLREKKPIIPHDVDSPTKYLFLDISSLKSVTVKILLMTSSVASFGIYTPMFLMALNAAKEGSDVQELVLLQTFLGISMALGVVLAGALLRRSFVIRHFVINTKIVAQLFISIVALAILFLSFVMGYTGLCILSWIYGIGLGGFQYSLKILALERIKLKHFSKAWGFIRGVESVPVLISVPLTSFLNDYSLKYGRAGYYICSAAAAISGIIIFFISEPQQQRGQANGHLPTPLLRHSSARQHRPHMHLDYPYAGQCGDYPAPDLLSRSCISLNQMEPPYHANLHTPMPASYCPRLAPFVRPCQRHGHQHQQLQLQQQHQHQQQQQHLHQQQLACRSLDIPDVRQQYQLGQGSIGARMGKRLQRSLSFIQQHNCCDGQMYCSWHSTYELGCNKTPKSNDRQPLICTCSPSSNYGASSRSRSVPEGLSTMSQQCNCRPHTAPSRDFIYVPHAYASLQRTPHRHTQPAPGPAAGCQQTLRGQGTPQCRLKRSQSLCRPVHFVEQITTSV